MSQITSHYRTILAVLCILSACSACDKAEINPGNNTGKAFVALERPDFDKYDGTSDTGVRDVAKNRQTVYAQLASYLVDRFDLADREGIGIDIGSGPGDLILHLAERTKRFYWINADINTGYTRLFAANILEQQMAYRAGFIFADACSLPFRNEYADIIVSRGSYQFWGDLEKGLTEIHRVLRPGGVAFVGRGVPPTMPEEEVRELAAKKLIGGPKYDPDEDAARFRSLMEKNNIREFEVLRHKPADTTLNYGVWLYFRKASD